MRTHLRIGVGAQYRGCLRLLAKQCLPLMPFWDRPILAVDSTVRRRTLTTASRPKWDFHEKIEKYPVITAWEIARVMLRRGGRELM